MFGGNFAHSQRNNKLAAGEIFETSMAPDTTKGNAAALFKQIYEIIRSVYDEALLDL